MSEHPIIPNMQASEKEALALNPVEKFFVHIGPIALFMVSYNLLQKKIPQEALYWATGLLMGSTLLALSYAWIKTKKLEIMPVIGAVFIMVFGSMTLMFHQTTFIKMKPTFVYLFFALFIFVSVFMRRNIIKILMEKAIELEEKAWKTLAVRWAFWFVFLAGLNELAWRNLSEAQWVNFKFWVVLPLPVIFMILHIPFITKHQKKKPVPEKQDIKK